MIKIKPTSYPKQTLLESQNYNYTDTYEGIIPNHNQTIHPTDILKAFIGTTPSIVIVLMFLRDKAASLFGLKTHQGSYSKKR